VSERDLFNGIGLGRKCKLFGFLDFSTPSQEEPHRTTKVEKSKMDISTKSWPTKMKTEAGSVSCSDTFSGPKFSCIGAKMNELRIFMVGKEKAHLKAKRAKSENARKKKRSS